MKRKKLCFRIVVSVMLLAVGFTAQADKKNSAEEHLDDMSFTEVLNSVPLDEKSASLIRKFQEKEGISRLYKRPYSEQNGSSIHKYRNREVLLITIPASNLFGPNEIELKKGAEKYLAPIKRYLKEGDMYRVLLVMHTDNTGSEAYREKITEDRSTEVFKWFVDEGCDTDHLFSYAYADEMPLVDNNSVSNREKNRRLEVYLVPGKKMLEQAKKGKIVF